MSGSDWSRRGGLKNIRFAVSCGISSDFALPRD